MWNLYKMLNYSYQNKLVSLKSLANITDGKEYQKYLATMLCGSLDRRGVWGRTDSCIGLAESLCCPPEIITTLLTGYTPIQNKKLKKKKMR